MRVADFIFDFLKAVVIDPEMALIKLELSKYGATVLIEGCQLRFISDLNT